MTIKCLLFDSDGTLVDSEYLCNLGLAQQFATLGLKLDANGLMKQYRGGKMSEVLKDITTRHDITLPAHFLEDYRARVANLFEANLKPIDGIVDALEQLDYEKAVVSNGPKEKIDHALGLCHLHHYFAPHIYSAYDIGAYKPSPDIYLRVAKRLGVMPSECVVIEDSMAGIKAGSAAKMKTFFYNTFNEPVSLPNVSSFSDMRALPGLIASLK